jgi:hypothetical protein
MLLPAIAADEQHLLYVANPGTRNYVEYGGVGITVFDIDQNYKFVRRIPTGPSPRAPSLKTSKASSPAPRPAASS